MEAVPLHLREANAFVAQHDLRNYSTDGGKFALGAAQDGKLVGVSSAGRPAARILDSGKTLVILQVCTEGTRNVNSYLHAARNEEPKEWSVLSLPF